MTTPRGMIIACALMVAACGSQSKSAASGSVVGPAEAATANSETRSDQPIASNDSAPGTGAGQNGHGYTQDTSNRTGAAALKDIFVRVGKIDGKPIKDFQLRSRCQTAFVTADGATVIDWRHVGNFAGRYVGGREEFAIDDGKGTHVVSVPSGRLPEPLGNAGAGVDSGMGVIADSCSAE